MTHKEMPLREVPLYRQSGAYAAKYGELEAFRASHRANVACKQAIEQSIREHFDGLRLDCHAVTQVLDVFGTERTLFVLAYTLQQKDYDGRFSRNNLAWAHSMPIRPDIADGYDRRTDYIVGSHPAILDGFVGLARKAALERERPSVPAPIREASAKQPAIRLVRDSGRER